MLRKDCLLINGLFAFMLAACMLGQGTAFGDDAGSMKELRSILNGIKSIKTYSYVTETHAVFPSGQTDDRHMTLYMDAPNKRLCYKHEGQFFLLTPKWAFQADLSGHTVSVFNVAKYNQKYKDQLPELEDVFRSQAGSLFIDSLLLRGARVRSFSRKGDLGTFVLGFPPGSFMKEMTLVYDYRKGLPESIRMKSFTPADEGGGGGTTLEVYSHSYARQVPDSVFDTDRYFRIRGGKVVLQQYKNYTISSIL